MPCKTTKAGAKRVIINPLLLNAVLFRNPEGNHLNKRFNKRKISKKSTRRNKYSIKGIV